MSKVNKELLKGSSEALILAVLVGTQLYGYEIAKHIKAVSGNVFPMGEGTLYPMLHKLEKDRLLQSYWREVAGRRRKYYSLTRKGRTMLKEKSREWETFAAAVKAVLSSY